MPTPPSPPELTRVEVPVDTRAPGGTTNAYLVDGVLVDPAARTAALDAAAGVGDAGGSDGGDRGAEAMPETDAEATPETDAETTHALGTEATHAVDAIAVTHTHPDHVGAVAEYAELTGATVVAHAAHAERFADATGTEPDRTVRDGDRVGDTAVRAVETPGHAADHLAFALDGGRGVEPVAIGAGGDPGDSDPGNDPGDSGDAAARRVLLCGDLAVAEGSVVVGAPDGDLGAYLASLERVCDGGYDRLCPGHGPPIDDPASACQRLIDHRMDRERSVLTAVERGASDVDAVLDAAYEKDLSGVEDLARATVVAHLEKLLAEGRIGERWAERLARGDER